MIVAVGCRTSSARRVVRTGETILFKLAGVSAVAVILGLDFYDTLGGCKCLRVTRLWYAHVEQYECHHE